MDWHKLSDSKSKQPEDRLLVRMMFRTLTGLSKMFSGGFRGRSKRGDPYPNPSFSVPVQPQPTTNYGSADQYDPYAHQRHPRFSIPSQPPYMTGNGVAPMEMPKPQIPA